MSPQSSAPQQEVSTAQAGNGSPAGNAANWDDEDPLPRRLSATEAEAFRDQRNAPSPWRVVKVQLEAGLVVSLLLYFVGLYRGDGLSWLWSALYGAAVVIVPGALMARGATRMADSRSPMATILNLLGWTSVKLICTVAMLFAAAKVLHPIQFPALLVALVVCMTVYWVALAWRSR
jgi:ATP synthase protein I